MWVAPFYEDNLAQLKEFIGTEHVLFGSDWPHAEGLAEPRNFALDLRRHGYSEDEIHTVMAENGWTLTRRAALARGTESSARADRRIGSRRRIAPLRAMPVELECLYIIFGM